MSVWKNIVHCCMSVGKRREVMCVPLDLESVVRAIRAV